MAHHKSAFKRHRQSLKSRAANRQVKKFVKTQLKEARAAIASGAGNPNSGAVQTAVKALVNASRKGTLNKKTASRRISRLMKAAVKGQSEGSSQT